MFLKSSERLTVFRLHLVSKGICPESLSLSCVILRNSILKTKDMKSHQKVEGAKPICMEFVVSKLMKIRANFCNDTISSKMSVY